MRALIFTGASLNARLNIVSRSPSLSSWLGPICSTALSTSTYTREVPEEKKFRKIEIDGDKTKVAEAKAA